MKRPEDDRKFCFAMIMMIANRFQTKLDQYTGELTLKQWLMLCMISNIEEEQISINDLAAFVGYTRQNTKKIIDLLVAKGYVVLEPSQTDKRAYNIKLTSKGDEYFRNSEQVETKILETIFNGIEKEKLAVTAEVLEQIGDCLEGL